MFLPLLFALAAVPAPPLPAQAQSPPDARSLWAQGERAAAVAAGAAELARRPDDLALRRALVGWELAIHRYAAALEHMEGLGPEADAARGLALYRSSRFEEALAYLDERTPDGLMMRIDSLEALERLGELDAAIELALEVVGPEDPRVLALVGRRHARAGRDAEAIEAFRAALARDPQIPPALFGLGRALVRTGERAEGLAVLQRHRELIPLLDELDYCERSLDLNPLRAHNHAALGDAQRALGRIDAAETSYRRAAQLAADDEVVPVALRYARLLHEDRGDPGAAVAVLDSALRRVEDPRLVVRSGDVLFASGDAAGALARFRRAAELAPGDPSVAARVKAARAALEDR